MVCFTVLLLLFFGTLGIFTHRVKCTRAKLRMCQSKWERVMGDVVRKEGTTS